MSIFESAPAPWPNRMLSALRIVAGATFITYGTMKLFGFPPMPKGAPPHVLLSQIGLAGMLEVFGGTAIVLGILTRPVAFLLAGEMAVAYFQVHFPKSFFPSVNGGGAALLYCFIFLYLMVAGAGAFSVDALIAKRRRSAGPRDGDVTPLDRQTIRLHPRVDRTQVQFPDLPGRRSG